jgi:hypothetical protein
LFRHSKRSKESLFDLSIREQQRKILRFAQNDSVVSISAAYEACVIKTVARTSSGKIKMRDEIACLPASSRIFGKEN